MESSDRRVRLADGHHLYEADDGVWRCCGPADRFTKLHASGRLLAVVQRVLHGLVGLDDALAACGAEERGAVLALLEAFDRQGLLASQAPQAPAPTGRTVHVDGDNPIAVCVVDLLEPHVAVSRGAAEVAEGEMDMLITCAGWLPDARWRKLDRLCIERELPWHMCYAEGNLFYVGPCSLPRRTATYADTRARRLAAAGSPDELQSHWTYLDRGHDPPPVPWPSVGGCALVAGILVADTLAQLASEPLPSHGHQLGIDPRRAAVRRHPVLPLPQLDTGLTPADDQSRHRSVTADA
jgi:ribosomal protein S12 methylthiotransferase accessory factor